MTQTAQVELRNGRAETPARHGGPHGDECGGRSVEGRVIGGGHVAGDEPEGLQGHVRQAPEAGVAPEARRPPGGVHVHSQVTHSVAHANRKQGASNTCSPCTSS